MYSFDAGGNPVPGYSCKKIEIDGTSYAKLSGFHHTTAIALDDEDIDGISDDEYDMEDDAFENHLK